MGKWSRREYDLQLVSKIESLFEKSLDDPLLDLPQDRRFSNFIKQLDPDDKAVQACFQSLVQQMLKPKGCPYDRREVSPLRRRPAYRRVFTRAPEDHGPPHRQESPIPLLSRAIPPPAFTTDFPQYPHVVISDPRSPSGERNQATAGMRGTRLTSPPSSRPHSPDPLNLFGPSSASARRRSASPSFSPSRALSRTAEVEFTRDMPSLHIPAPFSPPPDPSRSPPRSPSRIWLDEYQSQQNAQASAEGSLGVPQRRRFRPRPSMPDIGASYLDLSSNDRRRTRDEYEQVAYEERSRRVRRRLAEVEAEMREERNQAGTIVGGNENRDWRPASSLDIPTLGIGLEEAAAQRDTRRDGLVLDDDQAAEGGYLNFDPVDILPDPYPYEAAYDYYDWSVDEGQDPYVGVVEEQGRSGW